jgi:hypothetical protein
MKTIKLTTEDSYLKGYDEDGKLCFHLPLNNSPVLEFVPLLQPLEDEVEEAEEVFKEVLDSETKQVYDKMLLGATEHGFIIGYDKAKEKYKYTEEDLRKVIYMARETLEYDENRGWYNTKSEDKIIQSLQQPKTPVEFECEMENKIAIDGHTVIGSEPKTTTNPQGQTVLVGKYIY